MKISIQSFKGLSPNTNPRYLEDGAAQVALNVEAFGQSLKPMNGLSAALAGPSLVSNAKTVYRAGLNPPSDAYWWLSWKDYVDICRGQIAGDSQEWHFWTGDTTGGTYPKGGCADLSINGKTPPYPGSNFVRLGLPAPENRPEGAVNYAPTEKKPAKLVLTASMLAQFTTWNYQTNSCDVQAALYKDPATDAYLWHYPIAMDFSLTTLPSLVVSAAQIGAFTKEYGLRLSVDNEVNVMAVDLSAGFVEGVASVTINATLLGAITANTPLTVSVDGGASWRNVTFAAYDTFPPTAAALARVINTSAGSVVAATVSGTDVTVKTLVAGPTAQLRVRVNTTTLSGNGSSSLTAAAVIAAVNAQAWRNGQHVVEAKAEGTGVKLISSAAGGPVRFVVRWGSDDYTQRLVVQGTPLSAQAVKSAFEGTWVLASDPTKTAKGTDWVTLSIDGSSLVMETKATGGGACSVPPWDTKATCEENNGTWTPAAFIALRWGAEAYQQVTAYGTTENKGAYTSRVYVYTWLSTPGWSSTNKAGYGLTMESAPSPPSEIANVYADSKVLVQIFEDPDGTGPKQRVFPPGSTVMGSGADRYLKLADGREIHGARLYRSVNGVYLFVTEGTIADMVTANASLADAVGNKHYCWADDVSADELGEPCPSILWAEPPAALSGLINLPNGMVAGFVERDLYVCEPYRPYAWPESYINTLDYKIVGLGRMDTTLAVLTEGAPYFVQGSSPENLVVVKSDIEQSCVAKRSIVSMGGMVVYASPDGLVMLRPGGSELLTQNIFSRALWQGILGSDPANTFHAYGHDGKYVAFCQPITDSRVSPPVTYRGFVIDFRSKQMVYHDMTCDCAYADPVNDHLYLASGGLLRKWGEGAPVTNGRWRSKKFSLPQISGFMCAQVEAEDYTGLKCAVYRDGAKVTTELSAAGDALAPATPPRLEGRYPFRLEPKQGRDWEVDLTVTREVFNVALAQSMSEIAQS